MPDETIGVGIITGDDYKTIRACIESIIEDCDQIVVAIQNNTSQQTIDEIKAGAKAHPEKLEIHNFGDWIDDFAAKRNFCFSKLHTDWYFWIDSDDVVYQPENLKTIIKNCNPQVGAIWLPYHYAMDEFGNVTTKYERERLLRAMYGWIWKGRLHETLSPIQQCKFVRSQDVIIRHDHLAGASRHERNFKILNLMYQEDPTEKRIWLYMGHQHFAAGHWLESSQWYVKFGSDTGAMPIERFQALCYASKALRIINDRQAIDVALAAVELCPSYKDGCLELAHSYLLFGDIQKALFWATLSDQREIMVEPPALIFINPLEYTCGRFLLLAECYLKSGDFEKALEYLQQAYQIRPTKETLEHIEFVQTLVTKKRVSDSVKVLSLHLLNNKEISKLPHLIEITPYWYRDTDEFRELEAGIKHYTRETYQKTEFVEGENNSVSVDVGNVADIKAMMSELDKKYDKVTVYCPYPKENSKQINVLSMRDMKDLIISEEGRHIINLRQNDDKIWCEYDKKVPQNLHVRMFLGQGLEPWNLDTIKTVGCGGSETAAANICKGLAQRGCLPILYAMDNQVWDGVIYQDYKDFRPDAIGTHLFISSRNPDVFYTPINAKQKWLWFHDIHRWDKFTPEVASEIDVLIVLSKWHANFTKATYPFMKDAEVIDFDNNPLTYNDCVAPQIWFETAKARRLPKIAIIGNGLDTERFKDITETRIPHRFIWCSSPDRGLEQVLSMWSMIKKALPDAELKIFYGWNYFDNYLMIPAMREFKHKILGLLNQDGVEWCGRVGQEQLAKEMMKADCILYPPPHDFRETYGITFLEAQAAGTLCFYRMNGALGETIGDRGIPIKLDATPQEILDIMLKTLDNTELKESLRTKGREYAMNRTWDKQSEKMLELYRRIDAAKTG